MLCSFSSRFVQLLNFNKINRSEELSAEPNQSIKPSILLCSLLCESVILNLVFDGLKQDKKSKVRFECAAVMWY